MVFFTLIRAPLAMGLPLPGMRSTVRSPIGLRRVICALAPDPTVTPRSSWSSTWASPLGSKVTVFTAPTGTPRMVTSFLGIRPEASVKSTLTVRPPPGWMTSWVIPR